MTGAKSGALSMEEEKTMDLDKAEKAAFRCAKHWRHTRIGSFIFLGVAVTILFCSLFSRRSFGHLLLCDGFLIAGLLFYYESWKMRALHCLLLSGRAATAFARRRALS